METRLKRDPLSVGCLLDDEGNVVGQIYSSLPRVPDAIAHVADRNARAERLALCWNRHDDLVAALRCYADPEHWIGDTFVGMDNGYPWMEEIAAGRAALDLARGEQ